MRRIINLILEFKNLFFYLLLLFFTILFSYNNSNYNKSKIDELGLSIAGIIYKPLFFFNSYINLKKNNSNLIKENKSSLPNDNLNQDSSDLDDEIPF